MKIVWNGWMLCALRLDNMVTTAKQHRHTVQDMLLLLLVVAAESRGVTCEWISSSMSCVILCELPAYAVDGWKCRFLCRKSKRYNTSKWSIISHSVCLCLYICASLVGK